MYLIIISLARTLFFSAFTLVRFNSVAEKQYNIASSLKNAPGKYRVVP